MTFWDEVFAGFLANMFAGVLLVVFYVIIQWFLQATDVTVGYCWKFQGQSFYPSFDIRNRSKSKTYLLANIAYMKGKRTIVGSDNKSLWGQELTPGSIRFFDAVLPVNNVHTIQECLTLEVSIRLQNGRAFWLKGQGPGQTFVGRIQRTAFWLRKILETAAVPMEK
jgi:hypothetical protein